ncbi:MAG: hypothetical protein SGILL_005313 [Bacillariaceae sp.]
MKFSAALASALLAGSAVVDASMIRGSSKSARNLMMKARRLEDANADADEEQQEDANAQGQYQQYYYNGNQGGQAQGAEGNMYYGNGQGYYDQNFYAEMDDESMYFLQGFSLYLLSCIEGEQVINYQEEEGTMEGSTVIFRLCPVDTCDAESSEFGCESGYGDFAVGINTFVSSYLESQKEMYGNELIYYSQMGEEVNINEFAECAEYNVEENGNAYYGYNYNQNGQQQQQQQYYNNGQQQQYNNGQQQGQNGYQQNGNGYQQAQNGYQQAQNDYQNGYQQQNANGYQQQYNGNSNGEQAYYNNYAQSSYNGGNRKLQDNDYGTWYIGPGCTSDGKDIRLGLYRDQYCTYSPGTKIQDISYGWNQGFPFEDGGLIPNMCHQCMIRDQDYNLEVNSFCADPFRSAMTRCETNMTSYSYMGPNTNGCDYITNLEYDVFGDAIYGEGGVPEESEEIPEDETWEETALRFMDKMNTRQTRAFIAAMVLFSVSACVGASLITCMCFKKRRARKRAKALIANKDVYQGQEDPVPMQKSKSGLVDLIRTSSKRVSEAVATATVGTKVAVATAAAAVTKSASKKETTDSSYANMEDDIEKPAEGSYQAPDADDTEASASVTSKDVPKEITAETEEPANSSSGVLNWFGLSGSAKESEATEDKEEVQEVAKPAVADESTTATPSVAASSQKDLTSQMDDYFSEKFT